MSNAIKKPLVMIIDDDVSFNEILSNMVIKSGRDVYQVYSGAQAVEAITEKNIKPNLVICDIKMPDMSGMDFIKKNLEKNYNLNICMISGQIERGQILEALQLGAVDYLTKPVQMDRFVSKLDQLLKTP